MKPVNRFIRKFRFIIIGIFTIGILFGCQENLIEEENSNWNKEKNGTIEIVPMNGTLSSGALYEIVLPEAWNSIPQRILAVYAHGYRDADLPLILPNDEVGGVNIKDLILSQNLGYASTSYRENGLVVPEGVNDIVLLRETITGFFVTNPTYIPPDAIILVGPSEGGLITVLTIEQHPDLFQGAIATCCPIGNFYKQLQYYGDCHVLFKYFFGHEINNINLGSPKHVSQNTINAWNSGELPNAIVDVLTNDYLNNGGNKVMQFLSCTNIPADLSNPEAVIRTIVEVMRFPIKATNDAIQRLGGNPYNNKFPKRIYSGSDNDRKLNLTVERIMRSDWEDAVENVNDYFETTGNLQTPLVTMHTEFDPISFYSHETDYIAKVNENSPFPKSINTYSCK